MFGYNWVRSIPKVWLFSLFFALSAAFSFADGPGSRHVYIEGTAVQQQQLTFFLDNFALEAGATGYFPEGNKTDAAYTFKFDVARNMITYDDGTQEPAPPGDPQFLIQITLIRNEDNNEMVSFGFPFTELEAMLEYTQYLFLRAAVNIPMETGVAGAGGKGGAAGAYGGGFGSPEDDYWRNKWLYFRLSVDFPIIFYTLQPKGLKNGVAIYMGDDIDHADRYMAIDNRATAQPALTVGFELQLFNYLSIEPKAQVAKESLNDVDFLSIVPSVDLKFPLKFVRNVMLEPYATVSYPLPLLFFPLEKDTYMPQFDKQVDNVFKELPLLYVGGGIQIGIKGGNSNSLFFDISYTMGIIGDTVVYNHIRFPDPDDPDKTYDTHPATINFTRSSIGISMGYKFGMITRKPKAPKAAAEKK